MKRDIRLVMAYKNFAINKNISHIGLGVSAINTSKVLRSHGVNVEVWPITNSNELREKLGQRKGKHPVTHVVISAPWIKSPELQSLTTKFPNIHFAINCHSNVGFLQADANGVRILRDALELDMGTHNFSVCGNSQKFVRWLEHAYGIDCDYLPNLYYVQRFPKMHHPLWNGGGVLRIGSFGATRPQKNIMSAVGGAVQISYELKAHTEIWINAGRAEGGSHGILGAVRELLQGIPQITLKEFHWDAWPKFRKVIGHMHLLIQPSYSESFNMVTADGIAEGVPAVVSSAIDWVPENWRAEVDDVFDIACKGRHLIRDHRAAKEGLDALHRHNTSGYLSWLKWLKRTYFSTVG